MICKIRSGTIRIVAAGNGYRVTFILDVPAVPGRKIQDEMNDIMAALGWGALSPSWVYDMIGSVRPGYLSYQIQCSGARSQYFSYTLAQAQALATMLQRLCSGVIAAGYGAPAGRALSDTSGADLLNIAIPDPGGISQGTPASSSGSGSAWTTEDYLIWGACFVGGFIIGKNI